MIVRVFHARVHDGKAGDFAAFFRERALPSVRSQPGLVRVEIGWPMPPTDDAFMMITVWKDLDSMKAFTGESWNEAVILPEERSLLRETSVHHYIAEEP